MYARPKKKLLRAIFERSEKEPVIINFQIAAPNN
jgi:hypothetical protein